MSLETQTHSDTAYASLKRDILAGHYPPGVSVAIGQVEKRLGMSRTPIRSALQRLSEEKLLEVLPRQGFRVPLMSRKELWDVQEVLVSLEMTAIETICERCSREEILPLVAAAEAMQAAIDADDPPGWSQADAAFHQTLLRLSGNDVLVKCANQFLEQMWRVRSVTRMFRPVPTQSTEAHAALAKALLEKDFETARALHKEQRRRSAREIDAIVEKLAPRVI